MTALTYALVVVSAVGHASWNFLLKRSGATQTFVGLSKCAEAVMLAPFLGMALWAQPALARTAWALPVVGGALVVANYVLLAAAYRDGELSVVYPISRGSMLLFLPPLAFAVFGQRPDAVGWCAIAAILVGIVGLQLPSFARADLRPLAIALRSRATVLSVLAGLVAAGYTVWDKRSIQTLAPLTYFAAYTVIVGIAYAAFLTRPDQDARGVWRAHRGPILAVGILNSASYLLVLVALRGGNASYVIALRQLSIAGGAALGAWLLRERLPLPRRVGLALVVVGCMLLAVAR
jgi:drug/metabolite transporter (DMT)-like permease